MITIRIHKADPMPDNPDLENVTIVIDDQFPEGMNGFRELEPQFNADAKKLEVALHTVLPGGTYQRLYRLMAIRIIRPPTKE